MFLWKILLLIAVISTKGIIAHFEYNNVKCVVRDPTFLSFEYCFLRSINRTYKYFSLKSRFYSLPINNAAVNLKILKRDSKHIFGHYNVTVDGCRFLRERGNPLANLLFSVFEEYSNINHTCPYNHDIFLDKLPIGHVNSVVNLFIPDGRYVFNSTWSMNNIPRAEVIVYFTKY